MEIREESCLRVMYETKVQCFQKFTQQADTKQTLCVGLVVGEPCMGFNCISHISVVLELTRSCWTQLPHDSWMYRTAVQRDELKVLPKNNMEMALKKEWSFGRQQIWSRWGTCRQRNSWG